MGPRARASSRLPGDNGCCFSLIVFGDMGVLERRMVLGQVLLHIRDEYIFSIYLLQTSSYVMSS